MTDNTKSKLRANLEQLPILPYELGNSYILASLNLVYTKGIKEYPNCGTIRDAYNSISEDKSKYYFFSRSFFSDTESVYDKTSELLETTSDENILNSLLAQTEEYLKSEKACK